MPPKCNCFCPSPVSSQPPYILQTSYYSGLITRNWTSLAVPNPNTTPQVSINVPGWMSQKREHTKFIIGGRQ